MRSIMSCMSVTHLASGFIWLTTMYEGLHFFILYNRHGQIHVLCVTTKSFDIVVAKFPFQRSTWFKSFLHEFNCMALTVAWGVDEDTIGSLLESQNKAHKVCVWCPIYFPTWQVLDQHSTLRQGVDIIVKMIWHLKHISWSSTLYFSQPDNFIHNGGSMNITSSQKLFALHCVLVWRECLLRGK